MSEHENPFEASSKHTTEEERQAVAQPPTGGRPLILYDLATIVGTVYQQRVTLTRQETVPKRITDQLRPRLHGLPRFDKQQGDTYVDMLFMMAQQLGLINIVSSFYEGEEKPCYQPASKLGLEKWSRSDVYGQARQFVAEWSKNTEWHDILSADIQQWDATRPAHSRAKSRLESVPIALRQYWDRCEGVVYRSILASTLSELGIVSMNRSASKFTASDPSLLSESFKLTDLGASILATEQISTTDTAVRRILTVQPTFELILPQFDSPTLYRLLQFAQVNLIEQASRLTITKQSILRGIEVGIEVDQVIGTLKAASQKALPQNVIRTIKDWAKTYKGAEITEINHIKVSSEAVADELCSTPQLRKYRLEKIAPRRLLAHHVYDSREFRQVLKRAGIVIHD